MNYTARILWTVTTNILLQSCCIGTYAQVTALLLWSSHRYTPEIPDLLYQSVKWCRQPWGSIWGCLVFADHTHKNKRNTNAFTISARCAAFCAFFVFTHRSQYRHVTYAPDEPQLVWLRKSPEDSQIHPHTGIKMAQVLWSLVYICGSSSTVTMKYLQSNSLVAFYILTLVK